MQADLPDSRRRIIASRLAENRAVAAGDLAAEFAVSPDAIRRDLRALAAEGLCRRVYGGALPLSPATAPMVVRAGEDLARKRALARAALALIRPGTLLFLDNGSTNLALVSLLPRGQGLSVATNSVFIAAALLQRPDLPVHILGGTVNAAIGGCVDAAAVLAVQGLNIDLCFLGACSASASGGIAALDAADAAFKRAAARTSRRIAALVTINKLGTGGLHRVAPLDALEALVLEHDAPEHPEFEVIRAHGIALLLAAPPD